MTEQAFYIGNFIMEAVYLPVHLFFILRLVKNKMPTPVWKWFIVLLAGLWGIVGGNLIETALLLFWNNNTVYILGVDYQLLSTTVATAAFLIWNLYIAGYAKTAESKRFRIAIYTASAATILVFCTNPLHGLFYETLVLGEPVVHGRLFFPCVLIVYGMLFAGWAISLVHILRSDGEKCRRIVYFSLYPLLPGLANLVRSLTGFTLIDLNPAVMSVCIFCLYSMVFKRGYVRILPTSITQAFEQTDSILFVLNAADRKITYSNKTARERYGAAMQEIAADAALGVGSFERRIGSSDLKINVSRLDDTLLVSATDVSEIKRYQQKILERINESLRLLRELEEKKRNIDAYLDSLYEIPHLKEKQELFTRTEEETKAAFRKMEKNLSAALADRGRSEALLHDNLVISETTITKIRAAVALLKEEVE